MRLLNVVDKLKDRLKYPLPGKESQFKMAPLIRRQENIDYDTKNSIKSSVLILLFEKDNKTYLVFEKRNDYNGIHSKQICFPGGRVELCDKSYFETALRETYEEIGVEPDKINIIGEITQIYIPPSNYTVYPIIGYCTEEPNFNIDKQEVNNVIIIDLNYLLDENSIKTTTIETSYGKLINTPYYDVKGEIVWGATAMILNEFLTLFR